MTERIVYRNMAHRVIRFILIRSIYGAGRFYQSLPETPLPETPIANGRAEGRSGSLPLPLLLPVANLSAHRRCVPAQVRFSNGRNSDIVRFILELTLYPVAGTR